MPSSVYLATVPPSLMAWSEVVANFIIDHSDFVFSQISTILSIVSNVLS